MEKEITLGRFKCNLTLKRVRAPEFIRVETDGVTYLTATDYELEYDTTLEFEDGKSLPIHGSLLGETNRQMVIKNPKNEPTRRRGWVQGAIQLQDDAGRLIFSGSYYDVGLSASLAGDASLTSTAVELVHWESAFGESDYLGHALSMKVDLKLTNGALIGKGTGEIE